VAQNFYKITTRKLQSISPQALSMVLKNDQLKLQTKDAFLDFLLEYQQTWKLKPTSFLEFIHFDYLSPPKLEWFFAHFAPETLSPIIITSIQNVFKPNISDNSDRFITPLTNFNIQNAKILIEKQMHKIELLTKKYNDFNKNLSASIKSDDDC
jgi:hypothetical protein